MFYTLQSTNPKYDVMELKTLQDWFVVNQLKVGAECGGCEYRLAGRPANIRCRLILDKLVSYGLSLSSSGAGAGCEQHQCRRRLH